jgi:hypothetical protein
MPRGIRLKPDANAATVDPLVITWTANEPTASAAQTIANGTVPTVAELGQFAANQIAVNDALVADIAELRSKFNDNDDT